MSSHFMIYDDMENYFDIYIFNEVVNIKELKELIIKIKKENIGTWTLEMIEQEIRKRYNVKEVIFIDDIVDNYIKISEGECLI